MGRPSLSAEAIANNMIRIINTAMEMIREDGISSVTARSLGSRVGMNSALIYRYFKDIDEKEHFPMEVLFCYMFLSYAV